MPLVKTPVFRARLMPKKRGQSREYEDVQTFGP